MWKCFMNKMDYGEVTNMESIWYATFLLLSSGYGRYFNNYGGIMNQ